MSFTRQQIADWLDANGIVWTRTNEHKTPKSRGSGLGGWQPHHDGGYFDDPRKEWRAGQGDLIVFPGSVGYGAGYGHTVADFDSGDLEANLEWLRSKADPVLVYRKPSDPEKKAHVWLRAACPTGNGNMYVEGKHVGEWRGRKADGHLSGYVRCYPGEIESLMATDLATERRALNQVEPASRPAQDVAMLAAMGDFVSMIASVRPPGTHPQVTKIQAQAVAAGVALGSETEQRMRAEYLKIAPDSHGRTPDAKVAHWEAGWNGAAAKYAPGHGREGSHGKKPRRSLLNIDEVLELIGQTPTLDASLSAHNIAIRYNLRWMSGEVKYGDGQWEPLDDRKEANARIICGALKWQRDVWSTLWSNTMFHHQVDPFLDYLRALPQWDGTPRIEQWAARAFEVREGEVNGKVAAWTGIHIFLGAALRTLHPGAKLDVTPVIEGPQGIGKSWQLSRLFPEEIRGAFGDDLNLGGRSKEMLESLQGKALVEISEMHGLGGARLDALKAFMTRTHDSGIRLAWRKNPEIAPRRCVFVGTVNNDGTGILPNDATGNRRWVVLPCSGKGTHPDDLIDDLGQYWAEAVHRVEAGEDPSFPQELQQHQARTNDAYRQSDPLEEIVKDQDTPLRNLLARSGKGRPGLTIGEVAEAIGMTGLVKTKEGEAPRRTQAELPRAETMRLARALKASGWGARRCLWQGFRAKFWNPPNIL